MTLRVRWLGRVAYLDAHALQSALWRGDQDHLLLLEHPHVYTLGRNADRSNVLGDPAAIGADLLEVDRGGDVTYHGPGQLVGYPVRSLAPKGSGAAGLPDTPGYVHDVEQLIIDTLTDIGVSGADRLPDYPGVWVDVHSDAPRKIAQIGVRLSRGRSMHGFAINVDPDMGFFDHIVPCGIADKAVTSVAAEGVDVTMREVVDALVARATALWAPDGHSERADVVWRHSETDLAPFSRGAGPGEVPRPGDAERSGAPAEAPTEAPVRLRGRLAQAGVVGGLSIESRKPEWMRAKLDMGQDFMKLKATMRDLDLVTVCEEAGCPNIFECWSEGTATFMINGERCTRACGFCLVDTRHPEPLEADEPDRVAAAVEQMGIGFAVVTAVARDDLPDGGASGFAATIKAIRARTPDVQVEVLIPDCKGDPDALGVIFDAGPEVLNHNIETVARLQRAVRPSASYARSLGVLARAKHAGLVTKSSIIVGMGETDDEVDQTLADLAAVGTDIVTIGQYLRPTTNHLPIERWCDPSLFAAWKVTGESLGIGHVESSPLTRSSYHARGAAEAVSPVGSPPETAAEAP